MRKTLNKKRSFFSAIIAAGAMLVGVTMPALASDTTQMNQSITGALDVSVIDAGGAVVASPNVNFSAKAFSMAYQTSTGTLGTVSEKIRITNPSGTTDTWSLGIAATAGPTASWSNGTNHYDFNDPTSGATDGADTDSWGGQMTIDPSSATIAGVGGTVITNVSKGTSFGFSEGTKNSIDLMTASTGAAKPGQWDLTGISVSQSIPAAQAIGSYSIDMTLTAI